MIKRIFGISMLGLFVLAGCGRKPVREQVDPSLPLTNAPPIDLNAAMARARAEKKLVLLDFTGTDWCVPCIQLRKEIFEQPEFQSYAASNLIFLAVDFPAKYRLADDANATNNFLAAKFDVSGFPTVIALDGEGNNLWQQNGFDPDDTPKKWIATLNELKSKAK